MDCSLSVAEAGAREEQEMQDYFLEISQSTETEELKRFFQSLSIEEKTHKAEIIRLIERLKQMEK